MPLYEGFLSKPAHDNVSNIEDRFTNQNRAEKCCHNHSEVRIIKKKDRENEMFRLIDNWDVIWREKKKKADKRVKKCINWPVGWTLAVVSQTLGQFGCRRANHCCSDREQKKEWFEVSYPLENRVTTLMVVLDMLQVATARDSSWHFQLYACECAGLHLFINKVNNNNIHEIQEKQEKPAILFTLAHFSNQKQKRAI